jgi:predicted SAM-dependent methyltransferase
MHSKKLHLGCGKRYLSGFIHIDIEPHSNVDFVQDLSDLSNFASDTIDEIYCSHAFEYYDVELAEVTLREWLRVLKPGGRLFVTVPDFEALIRIYSQTGSMKSIIGPIMGRWKNPKNGNTIFHKNLYDEKSLTGLLVENHFIDVKRFNAIEYLDEIDPSYDDYSLAFYPHMDREGIQVSLAICGAKPGASQA